MSYLGVLPYHIRRSKSLSINAKIIYAEITACLDSDGVFKHTTRELARWYNSNELAIKRWVKELSDEGYIEFNSGIISMPRHIVINHDTESQPEETNTGLTAMADAFIDEFNRLHKKKFMKVSPLRRRVISRLKVFSLDQLMTALNNRYKHVSSNKWYQEKEHIVHRDNIDLLIRNDSTVDKWLNFKDYNEDVKDTTRETIKADFSSDNNLLD